MCFLLCCCIFLFLFMFFFFYRIMVNKDEYIKKTDWIHCGAERSLVAAKMIVEFTARPCHASTLRQAPTETRPGWPPQCNDLLTPTIRLGFNDLSH